MNDLPPSRCPDCLQNVAALHDAEAENARLREAIRNRTIAWREFAIVETGSVSTMYESLAVEIERVLDGHDLDGLYPRTLDSALPPRAALHPEEGSDE